MQQQHDCEHEQHAGHAHAMATSCSPSSPPSSSSPRQPPSRWSRTTRMSMLALVSVLAAVLLALLVGEVALHVEAGRDFYKILGVKRSASDREIKSAYRKLSKQYHPDKNPDDKEAHERFVDIAAAYETLSDKEKRRTYDRGGEDALQQKERQNQGGAHDPFDMFGDLFGGGNRRRAGEEKPGDDLILEIDVSLRDLYVGASKEVRLTLNQLCEHCRGSGAQSDSDIHTCDACNGQGFTVRMQPIGPGFMQQVQQECNRCGGKGKIIKHVCKKCRGKKLQRGQKYLDVYIEQGMPDGHKIEYEHAGDEHPDHAAGHIIFQIVTASHPRFERHGHDLHYTEHISLLESLVGFEHKIEHLDGHLVTLKANDVTAHGTIRRFAGEGMPHHGVPSQRGDLVVRYVVDFPDELTQVQKEGFARILKP